MPGSTLVMKKDPIGETLWQKSTFQMFLLFSKSQKNWISNLDIIKNPKVQNAVNVLSFSDIFSAWFSAWISANSSTDKSLNVIESCFDPVFSSCVWSQTSELEDLLEDLQSGAQQQQLFSGQPPVRRPASSSTSSSSVPPGSSVDKQSIISDILQMTDSSGSSPPTQHRAFPPIGPAGTSANTFILEYMHTKLYITHKINKNFFLPAGFNGARPGQPGRGAAPVRSTSLDGSMGPNPNAGRPFPPQHRNNGPYSILQQQQQGMMGSHAGMANQAAMANPGQTGEEIVSC